MHTSNLTFEQAGSGSGGSRSNDLNGDSDAELDPSNPSLNAATTLLGVSADNLSYSLCQYDGSAMGNFVQKCINIAGIQSNRRFDEGNVWGTIYLHCKKD